MLVSGNKQMKVLKVTGISILLVYIFLFPKNMYSQQTELVTQSTINFSQEIEKVKFCSSIDDDLAYNLIVATKEEIQFYDANSQIIARREYNPPYLLNFSVQGKYIGLSEIIRKPDKGIEKGLYISKLIDQNNNVIWEKTGEIAFDYAEYGGEGPRTAYISDKDGTCIMFQTPWIFDMYDPVGNLVKTVKLLDGSIDQILSINRYVDWSKDGNYFAIIVQANSASPGGRAYQRTYARGKNKGKTVEVPARPPRSGNPWIFLFNHSGEELWRKTIPDHQGLGITISPRGRYVIATGLTRNLNEHKSNTYVFTRDGDEITSIPAILNEHEYSDDERYVLLYGAKTIKLLDLSSGNEVWEKKFSDFVFSCSISDNGDVIAVVTRDYQKRDNAVPNLNVINNDGNAILTHEFINEKFKKHYREGGDSIMLTGDGRFVNFLFSDKIATYHIER